MLTTRLEGRLKSHSTTFVHADKTRNTLGNVVEFLLQYTTDVHSSIFQFSIANMSHVLPGFKF